VHVTVIVEGHNVASPAFAQTLASFRALTLATRLR
jgi:hypothetical protein